MIFILRKNSNYSWETLLNLKDKKIITNNNLSDRITFIFYSQLDSTRIKYFCRDSFGNIYRFSDPNKLCDYMLTVIDKNLKSVIDIGSGAGFPGLIVAILAKDRKIPIKVNLIEKSKKKALFLKRVINELKLDTYVLNLNVFELTDKIQTDLIIARAFKPLKTILRLLDQKVENWKKIFLFLGKTGQNELLQASKIWDIRYKQRRSVTSRDSIVIEINRLKKK